MTSPSDYFFPFFFIFNAAKWAPNNLSALAISRL